MGSLANYAELKVLDHILKVSSWTQATNLYIALFTSDPTETGAAGTEVSGGSYARVACNAWDAAASRTTQNTSAVTFTTATGSWGTVSHWGVFDASSGGNCYAYGALATSKTVSNTNTFAIGAGEMDITYNAGGLFTYMANAILNHMLKGTAYTPATNLYMALSTTTPTDAAANITEPSGNNYSRKLFNTWNAAASGAASNNGAITMATPSGSWGTPTYGVLYDASTVGNALLYAAISPGAITTGDIVEWATTAFALTID